MTSFQQNYEPSKILKIHLPFDEVDILKEFEVIISQNLLKMFEMWNFLVSTRWMHCKFMHDSWWAVQFLLKERSHLVCVHLQNQGNWWNKHFNFDMFKFLITIFTIPLILLLQTIFKWFKLLKILRGQMISEDNYLFLISWDLHVHFWTIYCMSI